DESVAPPTDPSSGEVVDPSGISAPLEQTAGVVNEIASGTVPLSIEAVNPSNGSTVGVAKPIVITFTAPVADRAAAEDAIHITSDQPAAGKFYWLKDNQVRWRPLELWPAHTTVNVDAAGTTSSSTTGDALIATADNDTHQMTITRNGNVEQTFPMSMGKPGHDTPN